MCWQYGVSLRPYSPLAAGHLARSTWQSDSLRVRTDRVAMGKYDGMQAADMAVVSASARHHDGAGGVGVALGESRGVAHYRCDEGTVS